MVNVMCRMCRKTSDIDRPFDVACLSAAEQIWSLFEETLAVCKAETIMRTGHVFK